MPPRRAPLAGWLAGLTALGAARSAAQPPTTLPTPVPGPIVRPSPPAAPDTGVRRFDGQPIVACRGQPIHEIVIDANPPLQNRAVPRRLRKLASRITAIHAVTHDDVVRNFLLLRVGEGCDELRRSESERVLRAQPFLVDARVRAYADGRGGVTLLVSTRDEFSAILGLQAFAGGGAPVVSNVRLGEANLTGRGIYAVGQWYWGGVGYRNGWVTRVTDYQFLGRPYQFTVLGERRDLGGQWALDLSHPYFTDLQRFAWRTSAGDAHDYFEMLRPGAASNVVFYERRYANAGGIVRLGVPGRLSVVGAVLSYEHASTGNQVRVLSDSGPIPDHDGPPLGFMPAARFPGQNAARINALWGVRNVRFIRVSGFDALTGTQDVRQGFQAGAMLGRSVPLLNSHDDDYYVSGDAYGGLGGPRSFVAAELRAEGRHDNARALWDGIVAGGRGAWYLVPDARFRLVSSVEVGATRRPRIPMQLDFGALDGGVRGYNNAQLAGAARLVTRVEPRWVFGPKFGLGEFGAAAFVDVGKLWAGDAPYGASTPMYSAVGIGLLGAFPPGSRRLWRVDVAKPLTRVPGAPKLQLILNNRDLTRIFWREPRDLSNGRERSSPASIYNWP